MREKTPEARERYLARHKSRMRRKAERRSVDGKGDGLKSYPSTVTDDGDDEEPEKSVYFDEGDVGREDYFDFGSDDEPSSEDEEDAELRSQPSLSATRLKVTDEGGPSPPASPPRRGLFGRKK